MNTVVIKKAFTHCLNKMSNPYSEFYRSIKFENNSGNNIILPTGRVITSDVRCLIIGVDLGIVSIANKYDIEAIAAQLYQVLEELDTERKECNILENLV